MLSSADETGQRMFDLAIRHLPPEVLNKIGAQGTREVCLVLAPFVWGAINAGIVDLANLLAREGAEAAMKRVELAGGRTSDCAMEVWRGRMKPVVKVKRSSFLDALDELNYESK